MPSPDRRLLEASVRVFGRSGFLGASTDALAKEAGLTKGALYWYFQDKAALFGETVVYVTRRWSAVLRDAGAQTLLAQLDAQAALDPDGIRLLHQAAAYFMDHADAAGAHVLRAWHRDVERRLGTAVWAGWLAATHPFYRTIPPGGGSDGTGS